MSDAVVWRVPAGAVVTALQLGWTPFRPVTIRNRPRHTCSTVGKGTRREIAARRSAIRSTVTASGRASALSTFETGNEQHREPWLDSSGLLGQFHAVDAGHGGFPPGE